LAAFETSQASLAALGSASRADMRALAAVKATTIQRKGKAISNHGKTQEQKGATAQNIHTLGGLSSLLKPNALSAKGEFFLHQSLQNKSMWEKIKQRKNRVQEALLILSEEAAGRWTSREVLTVAAFFRRLEAQAWVLFAGGTIDDLTTRASS
jgi:hypothetical protein